VKFKDIARLGLVLAAYASAACVLLAGAYVVTKDAKEKQDKIRTTEALKDLFPDLETYRLLPEGEVPVADGGARAEEVYAVERRDVLIGIAVIASGKSYQGRGKVMTGVGLDGKIAGARIIELNDTPGLGQNAANPGYYVDRPRRLTWLGQFDGMGADAPLEVGKDVQAITAATITSRALAAVVRASASAGAAYIAERAQGATE
jgi:Na+-translocating ferredoxin:NAD+ oxidoreductase subunit G